MSVTTPAFHVPRRTVVGLENEFVKMFDPPTASPATPELLAPTNPVPEFMLQNLSLNSVVAPHTIQRTLFTRPSLTMADGVVINNNLLIKDAGGVGAAGLGSFPAPTTRVPRGVIFHGNAAGAPSPHTIHWHGIEPTPLNDGVGHCSMEFGGYTFQWQPNFIGSYFYHCHRNTVMHFEFGLYGFLIIEPPDAYTKIVPHTGVLAPADFQPLAGGYPRRTAANLTKFPQFPGFNPNPLTAPDPLGVFPTDPNAMTVPYDVEALWVLDDLDSNWRNNFGGDPFVTFPIHGSIPGTNDNFRAHAGTFFAFNSYNPDYFLCTGLNFNGAVGSTGDSPLVGPFPGNGAVPLVPPELNSGVTGMQVAVNAKKEQTILIRALCAAYVPITITLPVDAVIIAFDGRALGVPPWNQYNEPFLLRAGTPYELTTARRFDALIRVPAAAADVNGVARVHFTHNSGGKHLLNGTIPITIAGV
jgi:FtsP/CotA-like multicopper oxidase with cupredoxin domain